MYDEAKGKILAFYEGDLERNKSSGQSDKTSGIHDSECICESREFPLTKNGKIDRKKLEEAYESGNLTSLS